MESNVVAENKKGNETFPFKGKILVVYGLGRAGVAVAKLVVGRGGEVIAIDDAGDFPADRLKLIDALIQKGMGLYLEPGLDEKRDIIRKADALILSPGVMLPPELRETCMEAGVEILGEFELAFRLCPAPVVAISGSNGKTTTSCLIYECVKASGQRAHLVGNIGSSYDPALASGYRIGDEKILFTGEVGVPFADRIEAVERDDIVVAEVSSYQLETTVQFHPLVAVLLNITEDHLARHGDMGGYVATKGRLFTNQTNDDLAVLNADDQLVAEAYNSGGGAAKQIRFSFGDDTADAYYREGAVFIRLDGESVLLIKREEFAPPGVHNIENLMAAALAARAVGAGLSDIRDVARSFQGVEHRIEYVGEFRGVKVYNDSKGTNPDSTIKALSAFDRPVILILGGYEKGSDFTPLYEVFPKMVKYALIVGATAERLDKELALRGFDNCYVVGDLTGALNWVRDKAKPGDILLLSPASASFDQFDSYEERGRIFKKLVLEILGE